MSDSSSGTDVLLPLVLASGSPRRRELLAAAGVAHEVRPADIPEPVLPGESPEHMTLRLAREKAAAVAERLGPVPPRRVLGADTTVVLDGEIIGQPVDVQDALRLLMRLCGRSHVVVTAVAIVDTGTGAVCSRVVESRVEMRTASEDELRAYVATGEPLDKAGGYAIQGQGASLVSGFTGSRTNIIGLPIEETLELLVESGHPIPESKPGPGPSREISA